MAAAVHSILLLASTAVIIAALEPDASCYCTFTTLDSATWPDICNASTSEVCVNMNGSHQNLTYMTSSTAITYDVVVVKGNHSTVTCDPIIINNTNYSVFPLIFLNSSSVVIESVHFRGCLRPLQFLAVHNVRLVDVSFSDFSHAGAVEMFNCPNVSVEHSNFTNNTSDGIGQTPYSGNAGALAIGYNNIDLPPDLLAISPSISIVNVSFVRNRALAVEGFKYSVGQVLLTKLYNQRGGGLACYLGTPNYSVKVLLDGCTVMENHADSAGGGVYMYLTGANNSHTVDILNTKFQKNDAPDGGGLEITYDTEDSRDNPNNVYLKACDFTGNNGHFGGGFKNIQLNSQGNMNNVSIVECNFSSNTATVGAALYLQSSYTIVNVAMMMRITLENCTIADNVANRGIVFMSRNSVEMKGATILKGNTGPAIRIVSCLLSLRDDVWIVNNRRHREGFSGALYLSSFGQLLLHTGTSLTFENNTGSDGACIVVKGQQISTGFLKDLYNPHCFMVYEDARTPPPDWKVKMLFVGNEAAVGPVLYTSSLDSCTWYSESVPFFTNNASKVWRFMKMQNNSILHHGNQPEYNIQTEIDSLMLTSSSLRAGPGDPIELSVVALDELGHNTSAFLRFSTMNSTDLSFQPSIVQTQAGVGTVKFTYLSDDRSSISNISLTANFTDQIVTPKSFLLYHTECLPGYQYDSNSHTCVCAETDEVALCIEDRKSILLVDGLWGAPPTWSQTLVTHLCPPGYCDCNGPNNQSDSQGCLLVYEDPSQLCYQGRYGTLCGQCANGSGVGLLSMQCREYTSSVPQAAFLLPLYVLAVIPALVFIVKLGVPFPSILKGFLFYIQVAPTAVDYLPAIFDLRVDPMKCIASGLAFYYPYDFDFIAGFTALQSYTLRYIAPFIAIITVPIAAAIKFHKRSLRGIWTVILLMYPMSVETAISLLFCPILTGSTNGQTRSSIVWFFDGNVECYHGGHLALALLSLLVLLLLLLFIPAVTTIAFCDKVSRKFPILNRRMERCCMALTEDIQWRYRWWPAVELGSRFIFITTVTLVPGYQTLPLSLALGLLVLQSTIHPYKNLIANYLESSILLCLVVVLALGNTTPLVLVSRRRTNFTLWPLFYLPVLAVVIVLAVLAVYALWWWYRKTFRRLERPASAKLHSIQIRASSSMTSTVVSFDDADEGLQEEEEKEEELACDSGFRRL